MNEEFCFMRNVLLSIVPFSQVFHNDDSVQNYMKNQRRVVEFMRLSVFFIIVSVPFYVFFTTWVGSNTGGLLVLRAWKEFLLAILLVCTTFLFAKNRQLREFLNNKLIWLITIFCIWVMFLAVALGRELDT